MVAQVRTTRTVTISEVKNSLSSLVDQVYRSEARIVVEKSGRPVAALVLIQDLEWLQERARAREESFRAIDRFSRAFADVPIKEAEAEIARIIAEIRRETNGIAEAGSQPA